MVSFKSIVSFAASGWLYGTISTKSCLATGINSIPFSFSSFEQNAISYFLSLRPWIMSVVTPVWNLKSIDLAGLD